MPAASLIDSPASARGQLALLNRLRTQLPFKCLLVVVLSVCFCVPYFYFGYRPLFAPRTLPLTALDRAIPFDASWTPVYQSFYLAVIFWPFLAMTRWQLWIHARTFLLTTGIGLSICIFWPTLAPRPAMVNPSRLYAQLIAYDPPTNAFPSMHIALGTQALLTGIAILRAEHSRWTLPAALLGGLWIAAIAYATLATRQHYAVDIPAGAAIAIFSHLVAGRQSPADIRGAA